MVLPSVIAVSEAAVPTVQVPNKTHRTFSPAIEDHADNDIGNHFRKHSETPLYSTTANWNQQQSALNKIDAMSIDCVTKRCATEVLGTKITKKMTELLCMSCIKNDSRTQIEAQQLISVNKISIIVACTLFHS